MKPARASQTAEAATAMRYAASLSKRSNLFRDPYASSFLSTRWKWLLRTRIQRRLAAALYNRLVPGMVGDVLIRFRYVQDLLEARARAGRTQYVILGAGWDSTALRLRHLEGRVQIFEVDHPLTQRAKREKLARLGIDLPTNLHFVPVDFERECASNGLARSSFDPKEPALLFWGGVTFYLSREAILRTLCDLSRFAAPGCELVFDYLDAGLFLRQPIFRGARRLARMAERRGEPFRCGFEPSELETVLRSVGFDLENHFVGAEQAALYPKEEIGIFPPAEYIHLAHAKVRNGA